MVSLFPETEDCDDDAPWGRSPLGLALADLMAAAHHFETECRILIARSQKEPLHQGFVTQQVIQWYVVICCCCCFLSYILDCDHFSLTQNKTAKQFLGP